MSETIDLDSSLKRALIKAVEENNVVVLKQILENERWPSSYLSLDFDLLVTAIRLGYKEITNILLDKGARVHTWRQNVNTPLHLAAARSSDWLDVIERLLKCGARVDLKNFHGDTPLHIGFANKTFDEKTDLLLRYHLEKNLMNVASLSGLTFLHIACSRPHLDYVQKLVAADENSINCCITQSRCTPLHFAVEYGRHEIAEFLIKVGASIYSQNIDKSTPMHFALKRRDAKMADILLAGDTERRNVVDKYNLTHFMVACIGTKLDVIQEYLDVAESRYDIPSRDLIDAQINAFSDGRGYTPLHFATDFGNIEVVKFLLDRGADCCGLASGGRTPHVIAEKRRHTNVFDLLRKHCEIVKKCQEMRAESSDYGLYGEDYERECLIEMTRDIKYHQEVLDNLKMMKVMRNTSELIINVDELWDLF